MPSTQIIWFRRDLRLHDQEAVRAAASAGPCLALYILDEELGSASKWWLHHSLKALKTRVEALGGAFILRRGPVVETLAHVVQESKAQAVHATRHYEPWQRQAEDAVLKAGIPLHLYANALLYEPGEGKTYKVFTPYWKALLAKGEVPAPNPGPDELKAPASYPKSDDLDGWGLLPCKPNWAEGWETLWQPGEAGARRRIEAFQTAAPGYGQRRNQLDEEATSRLSPHLAFGEISARYIWHSLLKLQPVEDVQPFLRQLGWRDFSYNLLHAAPQMADKNWNAKFDAFPWKWAHQDLTRWQQGRTGFPIIDAAMRQLWQSGWMHNRARMIVASFLTKNMQVHWRVGEAWFWDTLVDADLANNAAGWQWTAGSGADAAPYFRIFNPLSQAKKFDPQGDYVRAFVPELKDLATPHIHAPWDAPRDILENAGVKLGTTYPLPILDLKATREEALAAYQTIKT